VWRRLSDVKGVDILLLAIARVVRHGLNCKCVIAGDGPLRKSLSEQAQALACVIAFSLKGSMKTYGHSCRPRTDLC
jgi:glycosyltransferase involved in cell wall biosynthesis